MNSKGFVASARGEQVRNKFGTEHFMPHRWDRSETQGIQRVLVTGSIYGILYTARAAFRTTRAADSTKPGAAQARQGC